MARGEPSGADGASRARYTRPPGINLRVVHRLKSVVHGICSVRKFPGACVHACGLWFRRAGVACPSNGSSLPLIWQLACVCVCCSPATAAEMTSLLPTSADQALPSPQAAAKCSAECVREFGRCVDAARRAGLVHGFEACRLDEQTQASRIRTTPEPPTQRLRNSAGPAPNGAPFLK